MIPERIEAEARTEAALYGTVDQVAGKLQALRAAGVTYVLCNILAQSRRFIDEPQLIGTEIDLERLAQERMRQNSFAENVRLEHERVKRFRIVEFSGEPQRAGRLLPERVYERFPYVPSDPSRRDERCSEVYEIQVQGLATRLRAMVG